MKIVFDSIIFQPQGKIRQDGTVYWFGLIADLASRMPDVEIIIFQREGTILFPDTPGIKIIHCRHQKKKAATPHVVEGLKVYEDDDEMLRLLCLRLAADIYIGNTLTRSPGVINFAVVGDLNPDNFKSESPDDYRAIETADGFICASRQVESRFRTFFPHVACRPMLALDDLIDPSQQHSALRSIFCFIQSTITAKTSILLTAIVSTYNAAGFIRGCLADLTCQSVAELVEIIVVDSASEQDEASVVRDFQARWGNIKYIRTPERENVYQSWNRGIKFALGKYITNANTDDRHRTDAFEQMIAVLEQNDRIAMVYADVIKTRTANETFNHCTPVGMFRWPDWDRQSLLDKGCFIGPQPVWRKKVHETYGYFDERFDISSDFEFWLRISQTNDFYHIAKPLGLYLERPDSIEHAHAAKKIEEEKIIFSMYRRAAANNQLIGLNREEKMAENNTHISLPQNHRRMNAGIMCGNENISGKHQGGKKMISPNTILNSVHYMIEAGQKDAAFWVLEKLLLDFPDHVHLHEQSAALAYENGDRNMALAHYEKAAHLTPHNFANQKNLGDFYYVIEKDPQRALTQYQKALEIEPQNIEILIMAGHVVLSLERFEEAQDYYHRVLSLDPNNFEIKEVMDKLVGHLSTQPSQQMTIDEIRAAAAANAKAGDLTAAIHLLEQLQDKDGDQASIQNDLGVLHYECGQKQEALAHYQKAAALMPENDIYQKNLADFYLVELGDHLRAMETYVQVLKLNPHDVEALICCGQICLTLKKKGDARDFLSTVLEIEPWHEDARKMLDQLDDLPDQVMAGDIEINTNKECGDAKGQSDEEDQIFEVKRQLTQSPNNALLHNNLGVLLFEAGKKEDALACYEQAVSLEPNEADFQKNLADFYMIEQGRAEDAMKLYLQVITQNPHDTEALNATGMISNSLGQYEDARYFYERVLEIEPWNEDARNALTDLRAGTITDSSDDKPIRIAG